MRVTITLTLLTDGTLIVSHNVSDNLYGDTVKLRQSISVHGDACTTVVVTRHVLPAGVLQYFYLFIEQLNPSPSVLWLQIWRRHLVYDDQYQLLWQRAVNLNASSPHALYAVMRRPESHAIRCLLSLTLSDCCDLGCT